MVYTLGEKLVPNHRSHPKHILPNWCVLCNTNSPPLPPPSAECLAEHFHPVSVSTIHPSCPGKSPCLSHEYCMAFPQSTGSCGTSSKSLRVPPQVTVPRRLCSIFTSHQHETARTACAQSVQCVRRVCV